MSAFTHHLFRTYTPGLDPGTLSLLCLELACPQRRLQGEAEPRRPGAQPAPEPQPGGAQRKDGHVGLGGSEQAKLAMEA